MSTNFITQTEETLLIHYLVPYLKYLGLEVGYVHEKLVFRLPFSEKLVGNFHIPAIHGGILGGLSQAAMKTFIYLELSLGYKPSVVDFSLNYLSAAKPIDMYAKVDFIKQGNRISVLDCTIWQEDFSRPITHSIANVLMV